MQDEGTTPRVPDMMLAPALHDGGLVAPLLHTPGIVHPPF
jgi:hypothetical protein